MNCTEDAAAYFSPQRSSFTQKANKSFTLFMSTIEKLR